MLDPGMLLGLTGLALLDAVVTSTIYITIALLVLARRPKSTSIAYALGQLTSFFVLTVLLYFGMSFMSGVVDTFTVWARRLILIAAAVFFAVLAVRRLKSRPRHGIWLPHWINPWTAAPFGVVVMLMDLPFSFPMFLAVERLSELDLTSANATLILLAYTFVSSLPTVLLIALGVVVGDRLRRKLERGLKRFTTGYTEPSVLFALLHLSVSLLSLYLLFFVLG